MAISETFLYDTVTIILIFNAGLILTILAFLFEWPKKLLFHVFGMILFFILPVMHLAMKGTIDTPIAWTFFMFGMVNMLAFLHASVQALSRYREQSWRYE